MARATTYPKGPCPMYSPVNIHIPPNVSATPYPITITSQFSNQLANAATPEQYKIYFIPGELSLSDTVTVSDIDKILNHLGTDGNPVVAAQPFSFIRSSNYDNRKDTSFTVDLRIIQAKLYQKISAIYLNVTRPFFQVVDHALTIQPVTQNPRDFWAGKTEEEIRRDMEALTGLSCFTQDQYPVLTLSHDPSGELGVSIAPYSGADLCSVRVMFVEPDVKNLSPMMQDPLPDPILVDFGDSKPHYQVFKFRRDGGIPLQGQIGVIAYLNNIPTAMQVIQVSQ